MGAWWCSQGGLRSVSEHSVQTTGANARRSLLAKTGGCVRQNRVVLAPVAGVKLTEARRPNRVQTILQSVSDGDKTNSSPGRARHKPSNHCAGNVGMLRLYLYARVRFFAHFCTRDRGCSKHPAFPAPSYFGRMSLQTSGASRRGIAELYPDEAIQSRYSAPWIASRSLSSGGALRRPGGSQ